MTSIYTVVSTVQKRVAEEMWVEVIRVLVSHCSIELDELGLFERYGSLSSFKGALYPPERILGQGSRGMDTSLLFQSPLRTSFSS